ncbi:hypothetical protein [Solimonas sp. SE-A11]|uniref:hypothetical protein n=1 Tax=Solimonas sp. SE-A11 TaxID=3054954 RepID=UPI00259CA682|nr:hypothetical protein [Solimonas sp. SE-A11]MDM4771038.1 hypothetical protein [Solimonas sp. SE-A11]
MSEQTVVTHWFGPAFGDLHPLRQDLHRQGGALRDEIDIRVGHGLAGSGWGGAWRSPWAFPWTRRGAASK